VTTYVALLRAVNVGGKNKVAMADLRGLLAELGFDDPKSLLQSGNLVFRTGKRNTAQLERLLCDEVRKSLGVTTDFFVRTAEEWKGIVAGNPFPKEAKIDPGHLVVQFLRDAPSAERVRALQESIVGPEIVRAKGREAYMLYPDGMGRSKATTALIEKKLATRATARNWNTVVKLAAIASE
jgi:uncharacterized protein (DUF1697 family)